MSSLVFLLASVVIAAGAWWLQQPVPMKSEVVEITVEPGMSARAVVQALVKGGVEVDPQLLYWWIRLSGQARQIKAGSYEISRGPTPRTLLSKLVRGEVAQRSVTLAEGLTFAQWRVTLRNAPHLRQEGQDLAPEALMAKLGRPGVHPEGRFFPSTYTYAKGSSDLALLRRAMQEMDQRLAVAWAQRAPDSPLRNPDEALILASIVEKETGRASDRGQISGVFNNRLRKGMLLQTDPTVIYGLGEKFDGNLRKRDLQTDTPWNTYTRKGLPPTPIAMPGQESLLAAVQPEKTSALYFVARGDGTSAFSATLEEHNRAVRQYQLGQR
ncbi:MAG: endolytic transglycosylase MltG [Hylemonella sp.]|uniref:endolytic transglycosylase MltG n=1 Tax=Hylemonella sp. TaxID=2066020 RepID=UPI0022CB833F|nr:endolytic transglycosylase MltG [Hylemonella sp.]MCZ8251251.1 endolytic transglycosylase MltG [Hylemonella sp.]